MTTPLTLEELEKRLLALPTDRRHLVALVGAPGSGKSTTAEILRDRLNEADPGCCSVLAMDGYHFDDRVLEARGHKDRKGAPHTFDVAGLAAMLHRLKANEEAEIAVPVFDRSLEIARAAAAIIAASSRIVLVEGNYLLLNRAPWSTLKPLFELSVFIDVPRNVLAERLMARWLGFGFDEATARAKAEGNDLPNADLILAESLPADYRLDTSA